jgi:hypothetical protein
MAVEHIKMCPQSFVRVQHLSPAKQADTIPVEGRTNMAKKRTDIAGSTSQDGIIKNHRGPRGEAEAATEVKGRVAEALKSARPDIHWDMRPDFEGSAHPPTSGISFIEGSGSLKRTLPSKQWASNTDPQHAYGKYDHSPSRKPDAKDPVPQPKGEYYVGARGESGLRTTRVSRDSEGIISDPAGAAFHNKDAKRDPYYSEAEGNYSAPTDEDRRETATKPSRPESLDRPQTERGTANSDALKAQMGRNGYKAN